MVTNDDQDREHSSGRSDVDWEGERRWNDRPWLLALFLAVFGGGLVALGAWLLGPHAIVVVTVSWLALSAFSVWAGLRQRRRLSREIGIAPWQLPVVARRIQKERVPQDPQARRAMGLLIGRQRKWAARSRWMWPVLTAIYLLNAVQQWNQNRGLAVVWLCAVIPSFAMFFIYRRTTGRFDRVAARLGPKTAGNR
jgi:membrane protein implicated in regulation of membrane protease activity